MAEYDVVIVTTPAGRSVVTFVVDEVLDLVTSIKIQNGTGQPIRVNIDSLEGWTHSRNVAGNDSIVYVQNVPTAKQFNFSNYDWSISFNLDSASLKVR